MADHVVPEGALIEVTMTIRMPCAAAPDQIDEWLEMTIGGFGGMDAKNPLANDEPESWGFKTPEWSDTGMRGREEDSPKVKGEDGVTRWTTRRWCEPRP